MSGPLKQDEITPLRHLNLRVEDSCAEVLHHLALNHATGKAARNLHG